jgi:hypothetical protein
MHEEPVKDFVVDFYEILELLEEEIPFAFSRFSDGELRVLQNKTLILNENFWQVGDERRSLSYAKEERKEFIPEDHSFFQEKLVEAFQFKKENYFKGLSCRCCVGNEDFDWQINLHGPGDDKHLTWANLLINGNYPLYWNEMVPEFKNHDVVMICNEAATLDNLPFEVKKDFRVGHNCMINDYNIIDEIKSYIETNEIENHLFLFSAATLSNYLIYELYKSYDNNQYMDVGSSLNPVLNLDGWKNTRGYLSYHWLKVPDPDGYATRLCEW